MSIGNANNKLTKFVKFVRTFYISILVNILKFDLEAFHDIF